MNKLMYFLVVAYTLMFSSFIYAELQDPTRPPAIFDSGAHFVSTWQLDAILISRERSIAVINGESVKLGDQIRGNKLIEISPDSVQLEGSEGKMTLFLQDSSFKMELQAN